jgi:hypothetical protein
MVRLLAGSPEQHMQGISNDLCNRTIVRKHQVGHACEIVVEKRPKHVGFERLHKRGEAGNVGEKRCDFTTLPAKINRVRIAGKSCSQIGREVTRKRGMRPLSLGLPPPRLAQNFDVPNGLGNRRFKIKKIDGLGQKVECAAVHRGTNVGYVAIG